MTDDLTAATRRNLVLLAAGMAALYGVVGRVIERVGRVPAIAGGLLFLAASGILFLGAVESTAMAARALFGVGLGWSLSFVAATAELSERALPLVAAVSVIRAAQPGVPAVSTPLRADEA